MPKLKTIKGVKKRFRVTGRGKLVGGRAGRRHLLTHRAHKLKRQKRRPRTLGDADTRAIRALLPYRAQA